MNKRILLSTGLIAAAALAQAGAQAAPVVSKPYLPEGKRKPTFTEKRKAEKIKAKARKKGW